ncbi:hypothetical protein ACFU6S_42380 [Streptomyces sp. NPDC057456]|uniref:hypothetical protein n=1 Tax=Streptomyces sp. NPDC057456 TaxID=3346139 RepID=UPI0036CD284D
MIRTGRRAYTLGDLAALEGRALGTYRNRRMHQRQGHPQPVSSEGGRVLLYDVGQVDAWRAGRPVPPLPDTDDGADLLDAREAADVVGVSVKSWESCKSDAALAADVVLVRGQLLAADPVAGVEHWPRAVVQGWQAVRPGKGQGSGRPDGARDGVPRGELQPRIAALLAARADVTAADVSERLGIHPSSAQRVLKALRAQAVAAFLEERPAASSDDVAARLGYGIVTARAALDAARTASGTPLTTP